MIVCTYAAPVAEPLIWEFVTSDMWAGAFVPALLYLASVTVAVINIYVASDGFSRNKTLSFGHMLVFKLMLVPYFVAVFVFFARTSVVFIVILYAYLILFAGSSYARARLKFFRAKSAIGKAAFTLHTFAQFVFVLDVISTIVLAMTERKMQEKCSGFSKKCG
jgi:hypothetical protein